jgi:hypothetical protein
MERWWNEKLWACEFVWKIFLSDCHLRDTRSMNFMRGVLNGCSVIRWALCDASSISFRTPTVFRIRYEVAWQNCLTVQSSGVGRLREGHNICLCSETSEPAVMPTQLHIQCAPRLKRSGRDADCLHLLQGLIRGPVCQFFLTHSWRGAKWTH